MTNIFRPLLLVIAGATQKELAHQVKYLKVENQILRSKLPMRITVMPKEKHRLIRFTQKSVTNALRQFDGADAAGHAKADDDKQAPTGDISQAGHDDHQISVWEFASSL